MKILTLFTLCIGFFGFTQTAQIKGVVYSNDTTSVIPFTRVQLTTKTDTIITKTDINGRYKFTNLKTETYRLKVESPYSGYREIAGIILKSTDSLVINVYLQNPSITCCIGCYWRAPFAYPIGDENNVKMTRKDILNINRVKIINRLIPLSTDFK